MPEAVIRFAVEFLSFPLEPHSEALQEAESASEPLQDAESASEPLQDAESASEPLQDAESHSEPQQDVESHSDPLQDVERIKEELYSAKEGSKKLKDSVQQLEGVVRDLREECSTQKREVGVLMQLLNYNA
ncbi:hypothetical protein V5799_011794 [Amblyomma americanum]|uniref:Uncharacterized protein n=1 Tax=Amblyomma americanum TaxID=6943 RepID=A0AAQ4EG81_AMBAM